MSVSDFFNKGFERIPLVDKINYRSYLNLSSNEAHHDGYSTIFAEFIDQYDARHVIKYPVFREANIQACKYHGVSQGRLMLAPGSDFAINLLMIAVGLNAKGLITHDPNYVGYSNYSALCNMQLHLVGLIDEATLSKHENCLVAVTNPEGFFGSVIPLNKMISIAEVCKKKNHLLIIDEAYVEFNDFDHVNLLDNYDNVIIVRGYSKGMGLAGFRLGAILLSQEIILYFRRFSCENCISDISLAYLIFLLNRSDKVRKINAEICQIRDQMIRSFRINYKKWVVYDSRSNFIVIATESETQARLIAEEMLKNKVRVRWLTENSRTRHCIRITVPPQRMVDRVFDLIDQSVAQIVT